MAINEITSIDIKTLPPFKRMIMTLGELPTSYLESMTYAELLMWFCNFLQEKVLPTINNNADALQDVINYLENLDLQDEVNNKLDEMAESGQLQEIVADYLNSKAIFGFDTVADLKTATNLIDGSYAKTLGYYTKNDGGMATYKVRTITNDDIVDERFIIALNDDSLIAELIINLPLKVEQIGAYGDGIHDDTNAIQAGINKVKDLLLEKQYKITKININQSDYKFEFNKINGCIEIDSTELIQFIKIKGNRLTNEEGIGLSLISENTFGIQYCDFSIGLIRANTCIKLDNSRGGWINNNFFNKTNVSYGTGIVSVARTDAYYDGNIFSEMGFEDITKWFTLYNFKEALFQNCRMIPFEADGNSAVHELGTMTNCRNINMDNNTNGTYYEFINTTDSVTRIRFFGKAMTYDGVQSGVYLVKQNGSYTTINPGYPQVVVNMSEITSQYIINHYQNDLTKPIVLNYDTSKYMEIKLNIPDNLVSAYKCVTVTINGTTANSLLIKRGNTTLKTISSGASDNSYLVILS